MTTAPARELLPSEAAAGCVELITVRPDGPGRWIARRILVDRRAGPRPPIPLVAPSVELAVQAVCRSFGAGRCNAYLTSATAAHVFVGAPG